MGRLKPPTTGNHLFFQNFKDNGYNNGYLPRVYQGQVKQEIHDGVKRNYKWVQESDVRQLL